MKEKVMVVSRFEESLEWLSSTIDNSPLDRVVLYNKGPRPVTSLSPVVSVLDVPNRGREGGAFLDYIIDNHHALPDGIWFVQANPFDHSPDFLGLLGSAERYIKRPFQSLSFRYDEELDIPPRWLLSNSDAFYLEGNRCSHYYIKDLQVAGHCRFHDGGVEQFVRDFEKKYATRDCFGYLADRIGIARPRPYTEFAYGACFYVSGVCVARHPRWVYERLRDFLFETDDQGGFQVYVLERFWPYLLTGVSYETLTDCYRGCFGDAALGLYDESSKTAHIFGKGGRFFSGSRGSTIFSFGSSGVRGLVGVRVEGEEIFSCAAESVQEAKEILATEATRLGLI